MFLFLPEEQNSDGAVGLVRVDAAHRHAPEVVGEQFRYPVFSGHIRILDDGGDVVVDKVAEHGVGEDERRQHDGHERRDVASTLNARKFVDSRRRKLKHQSGCQSNAS